MNRAALARLISILSDSAALSLWVFPLVGWHAGGARGLVWALIAMLLLNGVPLAYLIIGRRRGWVSDWELSDRRERPRFIAVSLASDLLALVLLAMGGAPRLVWAFALIYACLGVSMLLISSVWKISLHMVSVAGFMTVLVYVFGLGWAWGYLALVPVAWARLERRKHTPAQLVAGALAGVLIPAAVLWFIKP